MWGMWDRSLGNRALMKVVIPRWMRVRLYEGTVLTHMQYNDFIRTLLPKSLILVSLFGLQCKDLERSWNSLSKGVSRRCLYDDLPAHSSKSMSAL